jgi:hypothetical protein
MAAMPGSVTWCCSSAPSSTVPGPAPPVPSPGLPPPRTPHHPVPPPPDDAPDHVLVRRIDGGDDSNCSQPSAMGKGSVAITRVAPANAATRAIAARIGLQPHLPRMPSATWPRSTRECHAEAWMTALAAGARWQGISRCAGCATHCKRPRHGRAAEEAQIGAEVGRPPDRNGTGRTGCWSTVTGAGPRPPGVQRPPPPQPP